MHAFQILRFIVHRIDDCLAKLFICIVVRSMMLAV